MFFRTILLDSVCIMAGGQYRIVFLNYPLDKLAIINFNENQMLSSLPCVSGV